MIIETYLIPVANLPVLRDKVDRLNRRAVKLGMPLVTMTEDQEDIVVDIKVPCAEGDLDWTPGGYKIIKVIHHNVTITGEPITEAGWRFVATLHHEAEGETLVAALPGETIPVAYRWANNVCDHCGASRRRNATFLLHHEGDPEEKLMQVGRNCLQDFLPRADRDPQNLARWAEVWGAFWIEIKGAGELEWGGAGRPEWTEDLGRFLSVTSAVMTKFGWKSRGSAREFGGLATADIVMDWFTMPGEAGARLRAEIGEPTDYDTERTERIVEWAVSAPC